MKRRPTAQNRIITVSNEIDDYAGNAREIYPVQPQSTYRQVDYSRLRQPITLPRWSRTANSYRSVYDSQTPAVPQLAPEIRIMPVEEYCYYENGDLVGDEIEQREVDVDGAVDVVAIEEAASSSASAQLLDSTPPPAKRLRGHGNDIKKEEDDEIKSQYNDIDVAGDMDDSIVGGVDVEMPTRRARCPILRRGSSGHVETFSQRARREPIITHGYEDVIATYDETGDYVSEEVEIVNQDDGSNHQFAYTTTPITLTRRTTLVDQRHVVNLKDLYEEMSHHAPSLSVEALNETFGTEASMSHLLNVKTLIEQTPSATETTNAKVIAAMAMQMNYMKRELERLREELVDTRSATLQRRDMGITGRVIDLNAAVTQNWFIPEQPPLRAVDLVKTARDVSLRVGSKSLKTRDVILRFIRVVFDKLIPRDQVRNYTVRDRPSSRGQTKDIGSRAKDQITACVLDLLNLYEGEGQNGNARLDRCSFSDFVNQSMKTVMYDLRRVAPKSRKLANKTADEEQPSVEAAIKELSDDGQ